MKTDLRINQFPFFSCGLFLICVIVALAVPSKSFAVSATATPTATTIPLPKGISAWLYDQTQARVDTFNTYNTAAATQPDGTNRQVKYLFPYGGEVDFNGGTSYAQHSFTYDSTASQFYASRMSGVSQLPDIDSDDATGFASWSTSDQVKLATDVAQTILADSNAAGVQLDIEPYSNNDLVFYQTLRGLLNAQGKILTVFTGESAGGIYSAADVVVLSGYDLGISPVTPSNYQSNLKDIVTTAIASAQAGGSYLMVGVPAAASYEEYATETGSCSTNTGYTQEQWFQSALNVLCGHNSDNRYLGAALWGFNGTAGLEITSGSGCYRLPGEIPSDNWTLLEDMNPATCLWTTSTPTITTTPTRTATNIPSATGTPTFTATRTATSASTATPTTDSTATPTPTATFTNSPTATRNVTTTLTPNISKTPTATMTPTSSPLITPTNTATLSATVIQSVDNGIYPNPILSSSQVSIHLGVSKPTSVNIRVYTQTMMKIREMNIVQVPTGKDITFALVDPKGKSLANGLYIVAVETSLVRYIFKLGIFR